MRIVEGKKQRDLSPEAFADLASGFAGIALDLGTGDGSFVLRRARTEPGVLCIGLDAVAEAMAESARRARAKPAKGGAANALYVVARAEDLPSELAGRCDAITINYPWGSLLKAVSEPQQEVLAGIAACAKPGARVTLLINLAPFEDPDQRDRLGLNELDAELAEQRLGPAYLAAGLKIGKIDLHLGELPERTSWGRRLVVGSRRKTLEIKSQKSYI
ncbi:class I SAM-dependent methyltransferase [Algihabitans albus]|uniref:class I SAM-dependent methyltransferase n=1 Tax=Algihabitans albus TaxID=2164067 RepID=UPI000E5D2318|nr:class I SAM-dependent methyltransferase [Algihabitans albus]